MPLTLPSPTQLSFEASLPPGNPHHRVHPESSWPTTFALASSVFPFERDHPDKDSFQSDVFSSSLDGDEAICTDAWTSILENLCPKNHVVGVGVKGSFKSIASTSETLEQYKDAADRYRAAKNAAAGELGRSLHTSISDAGASALDSIAEASLAGTALHRLEAVPETPDLFIRGRTHNRPTSSIPKQRPLLFMEIKPRKKMSASRCQVNFLAQAIKYAVIGRDMFACGHALYAQAMGFRRLLVDRHSKDLYVDIGQLDDRLEIVDMALDMLLSYGYVDASFHQTDQQLTSTAYEVLHSETMQPSTKHDPADLFYRLKSDHDSEEWEQTAGSRFALTSFLVHMGQSHFDTCRGIPSDPNNPLAGLTGRWARVRDVTLEQLGSMTAELKCSWDKKAGKDEAGPAGGVGDGANQDPDEGFGRPQGGGGPGSNDDEGGHGRGTKGLVMDPAGRGNVDNDHSRASAETIRDGSRFSLTPVAGTENATSPSHPSRNAFQLRLPTLDEIASDGKIPPSLIDSSSDSKSRPRASKSLETIAPKTPTREVDSGNPSSESPLQNTKKSEQTYQPHPYLIDTESSRTFSPIDVMSQPLDDLQPIDLEGTINAETNGERMRAIMAQNMATKEARARRLRMFESIC